MSVENFMKYLKESSERDKKRKIINKSNDTKKELSESLVDEIADRVATKILKEMKKQIVSPPKNKPKNVEITNENAVSRSKSILDVLDDSRYSTNFVGKNINNDNVETQRVSPITSNTKYASALLD